MPPNRSPRRVYLYGGPAGGQMLPMSPYGPFPDWMCINGPGPLLAVHYRHVGAGNYEYLGACAEWEHGTAGPGSQSVQCDCGCGGIIG